MADIGFVFVGTEASGDGLPVVRGMPLMAERGQGPVHKALMAVKADLSRCVLAIDCGDDRLHWVARLVSTDDALAAARLLHATGDDLAALQIERTVEEA